MPESIFSSLLGTLDSRNVSAVAGALGESENSVLSGLRTSIAAILAAIASKAEDPAALQKIFEMSRRETGRMNWPQLAGTASDPNSPVISNGKRMLGTLFGSSEGSVASSVMAESGLRPNSTSWIMAMSAPMVMSHLGRIIREEGMTPATFAGMFHRETPAIRAMLPERLSNVFWPSAAVAGGAAAAGAAEASGGSDPDPPANSVWPAAIVIAALAVVLAWLVHYTYTAGRVHLLPPHSGMASRLPTATAPALPKEMTLRFNPGASSLLADQREQLDPLVPILLKNPDARVTVSGYADSSGSPRRNRALSKRRADAVAAFLEEKGFPRNRITAEGYGEKCPIASNATAVGRAQNRRVTVNIVKN